MHGSSGRDKYLDTANKYQEAEAVFGEVLQVSRLLVAAVKTVAVDNRAGDLPNATISRGLGLGVWRKAPPLVQGITTMSEDPGSKPRIGHDILLECITLAAFAVVAGVVLVSSFGSSQSISSVFGHYVLTAEHR
jgi:hypothetical protein